MGTLVHMSSGYKVISQHGEAAHTRSRKFDTADEADAYAASISPDVDGSTVPNIDCPALTKAIARDAYSRGHFWMGNRYAATIAL